MQHRKFPAPRAFLEMAIDGCDMYVSALHCAADRAQAPCLAHDEAMAEIGEVEALRHEVSDQLATLGAYADRRASIYEDRRPRLNALAQIALAQKRRSAHRRMATESDPDAQRKLSSELQELERFREEHDGIMTHGDAPAKLKLTTDEIHLVLDEA